jgi:tRNA A-37 threonylcarbamoyl transferase component Bud32
MPPDQFRRVRSSLADLTLLASGRLSDIFAWEPGTVVKVFRNAGRPSLGGPIIDTSSINRHAAFTDEARRTRAAATTGVRVPRVIELIEIEGEPGMVMERVDGPTLQEGLSNGNASIAEVARITGELQARLLATPVIAPLPRLKGDITKRLERATSVPPDLKDALLRLLQDLPDADFLCHGDLHGSNVIMSAEGPVVIDWPNAALGHPLADVARTIAVIEAAGGAQDAPWGEFLHAHVRAYRATGAWDGPTLRGWVTIQRAHRISAAVPEERERLLVKMRRALGVT